MHAVSTLIFLFALKCEYLQANPAVQSAVKTVSPRTLTSRIFVKKAQLSGVYGHVSVIYTWPVKNGDKTDTLYKVILI